MAFTVDEEKLNGTDARQTGKIVSMDPAHPPVKSIPFMEYPRVVYKHPKEPFKVIEHRNTQHEVVHVERIPAEHISKVAADKKEFEAAMKDGWVKEPYVAKPAEDPNAGLYEA